MRILVTGGAGYIGSHTCLELLKATHDLHVVDNLENGNVEALERVKRLSNRFLDFTKCDVRDLTMLTKVFDDFKPEAVIHLAGLKAVSESVLRPALYYDVNVGGTAVLLQVMETHGCENIVFSSSATVYGDPEYLPCDENHPLSPINPYGRTKLISEKLLQDWANAITGRSAVSLRYFNPVGADISGKIGEAPNCVPNNLMPLIAQAASGQSEVLNIFGSDYKTVDGTGVRDYIHVTDLALSHMKAVEQISKFEGFDVFNVGVGKGYSVLELVREFEKQSGQDVKYNLAPRRTGDAAAVWADVSKAKDCLGFVAKRGIEMICEDTWRWKKENPKGYSLK